MYSNSITKPVEKSIDTFRGYLKDVFNVGKSSVFLIFSDQIDPSQIETSINTAKNSWKVSKWEYIDSGTESRSIKFTIHKMRV